MEDRPEWRYGHVQLRLARKNVQTKLLLESQFAIVNHCRQRCVYLRQVNAHIDRHQRSIHQRSSRCLVHFRHLRRAIGFQSKRRNCFHQEFHSFLGWPSIGQYSGCRRPSGQRRKRNRRAVRAASGWCLLGFARRFDSPFGPRYRFTDRLCAGKCPRA